MMTGEELKAARQDLGLTLVTLGLALGYHGSTYTIATLVRRYERGEKPVPSWIARLVLMYRMHGIPAEFLSRGTPSVVK